VPWPLWAWIGFLILFPIWAVQPDVAWFNLRGQWIESILTWVLAFGAVVVLGHRGPSLWILAWLSAAPVVLHLVLCLAAWRGLLTSSFYANPSVFTAWESFISIGDSITTGWKWQPFPMGFRGIEPIHGNIGYAACQSIGLALVCMVSAWSSQNRTRILGSTLLILMCFTSIVIAASRGAVYFGFLLITLVLSIVIFQIFTSKVKSKVSLSKFRLYLFGLIGVAGLIILSAVVFGLVKNDVRWYSMTDKVALGFQHTNPISALCDGLTTDDIEQIKIKYKDKDAAYVDQLIDGLKEQDGGRILLMRAGIELVSQNPRGLDGSRQSYEKLMVQQCGHTPVLAFSHAHQAWINLTLALGWLGGTLFAMMMLYFCWLGWRRMASTSATGPAMALFVISIFWVLRGFSDAVYQEHYLQMQAFMMLYLALGAKKNYYS
jgi:hypothetical protein